MILGNIFDKDCIFHVSNELFSPMDNPSCSHIFICKGAS